MNFQQVRDILNCVREYHRQFSDVISSVAQHSSDSRVEQIAMAMRQHEQHWQTTLANYRKDGEIAMLETWIQYVPDEPLHGQLEKIAMNADITIDDLTSIAVGFREALISLYSTLATSVSVPRVQQLFAQLLEMEESTLRQYAWMMRQPYA